MEEEEILLGHLVMEILLQVDLILVGVERVDQMETEDLHQSHMGVGLEVREEVYLPMGDLVETVLQLQLELHL